MLKQRLYSLCLEFLPYRWSNVCICTILYSGTSFLTLIMCMDADSQQSSKRATPNLAIPWMTYSVCVCVCVCTCCVRHINKGITCFALTNNSVCCLTWFSCLSFSGHVWRQNRHYKCVGEGRALLKCRRKGKNKRKAGTLKDKCFGCPSQGKSALVTMQVPAVWCVMGSFFNLARKFMMNECRLVSFYSYQLIISM